MKKWFIAHMTAIGSIIFAIGLELSFLALSNPIKKTTIVNHISVTKTYYPSIFFILMCALMILGGVLIVVKNEVTAHYDLKSFFGALGIKDERKQ